MIEVNGLTRHFGDVVAVEDLTLSVGKGEVFGFLGPNGAGKTTTVRMLAALIAPTSGEATIAGFRVGPQSEKIRAAIGILTETPGLYSKLDAVDNLRLFAELHQVDNVDARIKRYLQMLGLWERRYAPVGSFSKGMRQKLAIARALIHEPQIVFLDEPTSALDPVSAKVVRDFIEELSGEGRTIFLCTHNLDEADRLCDRIALFRQRLIKVDTPEALRRGLYGTSALFRLGNLTPEHVNIVRALPFVERAEVMEDNRLRTVLENPETNNPRVVRALVEAGADIIFVEEEIHSLEQVYFDLLSDTPTRATQEATP